MNNYYKKKGKKKHKIDSKNESSMKETMSKYE